MSQVLNLIYRFVQKDYPRQALKLFSICLKRLALEFEESQWTFVVSGSPMAVEGDLVIGLKTAREFYN